MKNFLFLLLAWLSMHARAQMITVIDNVTQQTIPGVVVYDKSGKSATSNGKGEVDGNLFKNSDSIYFKHVSYLTVIFSYKQLEEKKFRAELKENNISLSEIVVSASRWEDEQVEIPYRVEKLNMKEVAFQNPQTTADLLGTSGFAYIQKSQLAGGSPMLRGFATNRVMMVIDGVRMNNAIFRAGNVQNVISIDANALQSTEILFGPGAVMYGSDAIGGVMDFHTLDPKLADSAQKVFVSGNGMGRFSSANLEQTGHIDFNIGLKKWAFVTSVTYADYNDLRSGSNGNSYYLRPSYQQTIDGKDSQFVNTDPQKLVHSGYSQFNGMQKIRFKPNRYWDLDYAFHYSATSNAPRYDRLYIDANKDSVLDNAVWYYGPQQWMMNRLAINHSRPTKMYNHMRVLFAMQNYEESRHDRKFNNKKQRNQTETVDGYSFNMDFDKRTGEKTILFYGLEAVHNLVGSVANREHIVTLVKEPTNTRYPDGSTMQLYGAYANLKHKFNSKWIMNTGVRYTHYFIAASFDTSLFALPFVQAENNNGALNGSIGFVFTPDKTFQVYANSSTGFRAPNIDDMGKIFDPAPGSVIVPNTNLKPEYAYNAEIGFAKVFGKFLKTEFSGYYIYLDNALARRNFKYQDQDSIVFDGQLSQVQAIQNVTNAYVYGLQARLDVSFGKGWGMNSSICYQFGEERSIDSLKYYPKQHVPPVFGNTHFTYERKKLKFDLYAIYNGAMDFEDLPLSEIADSAPYAKDSNGLPFTPAWYTLNFKFAYFINKTLSMYVGVENMTDQLYRPYASGITAPGRNIIASVKYKI